MSTLLPNTFQCFNLYIDRALEHLTDSEVRILWFTTRHILGWQDKIKKQHGHISLTMFEKGYSTESGKRYGGCGLGRGAIITACKGLVEFQLLKRIGAADEDGQEWELTTENILWDKLEARTTGKAAKSKDKTQKATTAMMNKRAGTSNEPPKTADVGGTSDVTMQGTSDVTTPHNVARTESKPSSKPSSKPVTSTNVKVPKTELDSQYDAISEIWDTKANGTIVSMRGMIFGSTKTRGQWKLCQFEPPATIDELKCFAPYMETRMKDKKLTDKPTTPVVIQRWFYDYRADVERKAQAPQSSQPTEAEMNIRAPNHTDKIAQWLKEKQTQGELL